MPTRLDHPIHERLRHVFDAETKSFVLQEGEEGDPALSSLGRACRVAGEDIVGQVVGWGEGGKERGGEKEGGCVASAAKSQTSGAFRTETPWANQRPPMARGRKTETQTLKEEVEALKLVRCRLLSPGGRT